MITREEILKQFYNSFCKPYFKDLGHCLPENVNFSVSWPSHKPTKVLGQCFNESLANGEFNIYVTPKINDVARIFDIIMHEVIHVIFPTAGHGKQFSQLAKRAGLVKPWTATTASPELNDKLTAYIENNSITWNVNAVSLLEARKKQTTRMIKLECDNCGCIIRMSKTALQDAGTPICGCSPIEHDIINFFQIC